MNGGEKLTPEMAMRLAIEEARKGRGFVSPNPLVGCTIVDRDHRFLTVGYHERCGQGHAEVNALAKIKDPKQLEGATLYVTLEPCAHEGKTGSCAKAIAKLPVKRVVFGLVDPFPLVAGKGAQILRDAGIEAIAVSDFSEIADRAALLADLEELPEIFLHNVRAQEPFVSIKVASSLDGVMALKNGESKWITGESSRAFVQELRLGYDAVLIGRNTFEKDNPTLNIRLPNAPVNKVVILDPSGKTLPALAGSELLKTRPAKNIFVVCAEMISAANPSDVNLLKVKIDNSGQFVVPELLKILWENGIRSLFVEGGASTYASFLEYKKVQRLHLFIAPILLGTKKGVSWSNGLSIESMKDRLVLQNTKTKSFDADLYVSGRMDR